MSRLLRLALWTYPRHVRRADGDVLLGLALDMVDGGSSVGKEAADLAAGGVAERVRLTRMPVGAALERIGLPVAGLLLAAMLVGAFRIGDVGVPRPFWLAGLGGALLALVGVAARRRVLAVPGALVVLGVCSLDSLRGLDRGGAAWVAITDRLSLDVLPSLLPAAVVLVLTACAAGAQDPPRRPRLRGLVWTFAGTLAGVCALRLLDPVDDGAFVLTAGAVAMAALAAWQLWRGPTGRLAAALALGVLAPAGLWGAAGAWGGALGDTAAYATLYGGYALAALLVLTLLRSSVAPSAPRSD